MGTYLSTPVTEKDQEEGESLGCPSTPVAWGVVDMQGWRKSMEDAHIAQTDLKVPLHHFGNEMSDEVDGKVFGVFDGHGGPEVARFCQLYLIDVLTRTPTWQEEHHAEETATNPEQTDIGRALISAFHGLDKLIDSSQYLNELMELKYNKPDPKERRIAKPLEEGKTEASHDASKDESTKPAAVEKSAMVDVEGEETAAKSAPETGSSDDSEKDTETEASTTESSNSTAEETEGNDDDSTEVVGKEEAAAEDQIDEEMEEKADEVDAPTNGKVGVLFQKFLNMSSPEAGDDRKLSTSVPSVMQNGRLVCNLPDHPIHAGATAIVAVIIGRILTVANAGDSRGVLCEKGGQTHALSLDHKPQDKREMDRITLAGGFVNQFGRVNGNLNLSRSIGDLKYKQRETLPPDEQMITAEPDITQVVLDPEDEFIILGCDGIWDCLSNEQAVEFVRSRIDKKYPTQIGIEMLDEIISHDPRLTQGIGGDNMTIMVIDLLPKSRPYRNGVEPEPTTESPKKEQPPQSMQLDEQEYEA